jgi:hypothetical protein
MAPDGVLVRAAQAALRSFEGTVDQLRLTTPDHLEQNGQQIGSA